MVAANVTYEKKHTALISEAANKTPPPELDGVKIAKVPVFFDQIAKIVLETENIFSINDNDELYLYVGGVYKRQGIKSELGNKIRDLYDELIFEKTVYETMKKNKDLAERDARICVRCSDLKPCSTHFINECFAYFRDKTSTSRKEIDNIQRRYLNFQNGVFDLDTYEFQPHDPKIKLVAQMPVDYNPEAKCPLIDNFLKSCELTDIHLQTLLEFSALSLTTEMKMQKAMMLYGTGSNGKSVYINLMKTLLGSDLCRGESLQNLEDDKFRLANLYGCRLNAFPDLKDSPLQTNEVFNTIVGGDVGLVGERKFEQAFEFTPTMKMLFSANRIPFAYSDNYAYYRRWLLIQFPKTFRGDEIDENLLAKLTTSTELSGFVNCLLTHLSRIRSIGRFTYEPNVKDSEKTYLKNSNPVGYFVEEYCRECQNGEEPTEKDLLYKTFEIWCHSENINVIKNGTFTKKLSKMGHALVHTTRYQKDRTPINIRYYTDLVLAHEFKFEQIENVDDMVSNQKKYAMEEYAGHVENIDEFCTRFLVQHPQYANLEMKKIREYAKKLKERGWN